MSRAFSLSPLLHPNSITPPSGLIVKISATATRNVGMSVRSLVVKPPSHPTYDLKGFIQPALSEDAGDRGDVTCKATVPAEMEMEAEALFLAKEDGIEAGIALAKKVFGEVDPSLKVQSSPY